MPARVKKSLFVIESHLSKPKYEQIGDAIIKAIIEGSLKQGDLLPSIAALARDQQLAKATVAKSYDALCERGIIMAKQGKGFYVASTTVQTELNIFLLFDTFNHYKEILYHAFKRALPPTAKCSIFFHHYNREVFESLIGTALGKYTHYVVLPHFNEDVSEALNRIPPEKLLVLDRHVKGLPRGSSSIFQPFRKDAARGLEAAGPLLKRYKALRFVRGASHFQHIPKELIAGVRDFVKAAGMPYSIEDDLDPDALRRGEAYFLCSDSDMVRFVKQAHNKGLVIGRDIGMITYDDTPLKEVLLDGVSVITTDFEHMGRKAAEAILERKLVHIENPATFIRRNTL